MGGSTLRLSFAEIADLQGGSVNLRWFWNWGWVLGYTALLALSVMWVTTQNREPIEEVQEEKITITFRHFWNKEHDRQVLDIFEDIVQTYQEDHPNVKISFEGMDQTIHREQKLKSEMVTGTPPDMFVLFGGAEIEPYVRSNRLMDLTSFVARTGIGKQFKDLHLWTFDHRIYGLPFEGNAEPIYYNKTIFRQLGLTPPETLAELDQAVRILKERGFIPFALGNEDRWPGGIFAHYLMDRYAGPEMIETLIQGKPDASFLNRSYLEAFRHLERWIHDEAFSPNSNALSTEEAIQLFASGQAAMYVNGNWDIGLFRSESNPHFQDEVGVIPFPVMTPGSSASMAGGYTIGIGLSSDLDEAKRQAALDLLEMFYTTEVQTRLVYEAKRIPSMKIQFDPERTGPVFAQVIDLMEDTRESFVPYDNMLSPEVKKSFLKVVEDMLGGRLDAESALKQIQLTSLQYWELRRSSASAAEE